MKQSIADLKVAILKTWILDCHGLPDYKSFMSELNSPLFKTESAFISAYYKNYVDIMKTVGLVNDTDGKERVKIFKKGLVKNGMLNLATVNISLYDKKIIVCPFNKNASQTRTLLDISNCTATVLKTVFDRKTNFPIMKVIKIKYNNDGIGTRYLMIDWNGEVHLRKGYAFVEELFESTAALRRKYLVQGFSSM